MNKQPKKRYGTLIVDPPWDIGQKSSRGAKMHYNLMTLEQIKAMPIADLAEPNAHCWLWVTNSTLRHGYDVLEGWGFTPHTPFTWIKPRMGMGSYLRSMTEHVLFGTRGKAPALFKSQPNWGFFPVQDHSHKPEELHQIVKRVSPGPYLELFARREYPGFHIWGNEVLSDIEIPGYPVPHVRREEER